MAREGHVTRRGKRKMELDRAKRKEKEKERKKRKDEESSRRPYYGYHRPLVFPIIIPRVRRREEAGLSLARRQG